MTHFGLKIVAILLTTATVGAVVFQVSDVLKVHALNVHVEVKPIPPGVFRVMERTGEPPWGLVNPEGNQTTPFTIDSDGNSGTDPPDDNPPDGNGPTTQAGNKPTPPPEDETLPPGIAKIIQKTGAAPPGIVKLGGGAGSVLYLNTPIDFGTVFPEETLTEHFIIGLQGVTDPTGIGPPWWGEIWDPDETYTYVEYKITVGITPDPPETGYLSLKDYLTLTKATETDTNDDASAIPPDNVAYGILDDSIGDTEDTWYVTLNTPDITGDYWSNIEVQVVSTTPPPPPP